MWLIMMLQIGLPIKIGTVSYTHLFVFPGAIDKGMIAEIKPNGTDIVKAYSIDLKDYVEFGLSGIYMIHLFILLLILEFQAGFTGSIR